MKGYLGNPDQTKTHANPRAHKNRNCVTCIHRSSPSTQRVASKQKGAYHKVSSSSPFPPSEARKKSPMDKAEKQKESSNKHPQEKKAFPSKPQAFLLKDKNIIAVCQGISFMTIHSWYHLSIGRGIVASLSIYKSAAVRLSLCSLCSLDRYLVMFFLSLICC
jgi:hypothetical protein